MERYNIKANSLKGMLVEFEKAVKEGWQLDIVDDSLLSMSAISGYYVIAMVKPAKLDKEVEEEPVRRRKLSIKKD